MLLISLSIVDFLKSVKDGTEDLDIFFLSGMGEEGSSTRNNPPMKCLRGHVQKAWFDLKPWKGSPTGLDPPHQPIAVAIEGDNMDVEAILRSWMDTFQGVGGLKLTPIKLFEKFAYSEASQLHGNMLQKESFQKNQAKEFLTTIQNIKTAIMNIETDIEKLDEQIAAFKSGDWEKIKWLFIDNYGGPDRSWTAIARQVPLVRLSMTWFLRLKTKAIAPFGEYMKILVDDSKKQSKLETLEKRIKKIGESNKAEQMVQIDKLVKEEQMNPAIANHLKSKIQEFWNWVGNYSSWIKKSRDRILKNSLYQKTNLKMYMEWASDAIGHAERLKMDSSSMESLIPDFTYKHTPREMTSMEYIFAADSGRPEILERCRPWVPVILTHIDITSSVELQKKFAAVSFLNINGFMRLDQLEAVKNYLSHGKPNLISKMLKSGAMSNEEIKTIFTTEEIEVLKGESKGQYKFTAQEKGRLFKVSVWDSFVNSMKIFGVTGHTKNVDWAYNMRAAGYAYDLLLRGIDTFKEANGMFTIG